MAMTAGEGPSSSYSAGAGGKFRRKPLRRAQATPYDRPPTALRNPRTNNGWLSKIVVDPASKLISASARLFFSSLFRKRLPPAPPRPEEPVANQESRDAMNEAVLDSPPGVQPPSVNNSGKLPDNFDSCGLSELEQMLKEKTFTRSEIDHLTELLRSRTIDIPNEDEDKRTKSKLPEPVSANGRQHELTSSPIQENRRGSLLERHALHASISTPVGHSQVLEEDIAAPAELAKAYMGSRPSKVSPSGLALRSSAVTGDASLLGKSAFAAKSPVMSIVPKPTVHAMVPENGFPTPRSRGRSTIYNMARTPYSRICSSTQKSASSTYDGYGGPSASSSHFPWEHDRQSGSKQLALKRRSSVFEDDIGSVGPIRRLRQKTNFSTPKSLRLPSSGSPLSICGAGGGPDATQNTISSIGMLASLDASNHGISKTVAESENNTFTGTGYTPVPSKSRETAAKILEQLEKLVPKEKSSEGKLIALREKSPSKLASSVSRGQAIRILEDVHPRTILHSPEDSQKLKGVSNTAVSVKETVPGVRTTDSVTTKFFGQFSWKKQAFQMSAHEHHLELNGGLQSNDAASTEIPETTKPGISLVESKPIFSNAGMADQTPVVPEFDTPAGLELKKPTDLGTSDRALVEKSTGFTFPMSPTSIPTFHPVVASPQSTTVFDKIVPPKEPNATPLFSSISKNVDKVPSFSSSSAIGESSGLKSSLEFKLEPESSDRLAQVASGASDTVSKLPDLDKADNKNVQKSTDIVSKAETSIFSVPTSSTSSIFSFGLGNKSCSSNGSLESRLHMFSSPALASANFTNQTLTSSFPNVALTSTSTMTTNEATTPPLSSSTSSSGAAPSLPAFPIFKYGSSGAPNSVTAELVTSTTEAIDPKGQREITLGNQTTTPSFGGTSFAMASKGNSIFGFTASATSLSANNLSQDSPFGSSSGSLISSQISPAGTVTQSIPVQVASSASSPIFGTSGITSFSSSSPLFGSSSTSRSVFGSSTSSSSAVGSSTSSSSLFCSSTPNLFSSSAFGQSSSASLPETNSMSSGNATSSSFGSSLQPTQSSIFGSTLFNTESKSTGFPFGLSSVSAAATNTAPVVFGSSTGASTVPIFPFTAAAAAASSSQTQPVFDTSFPVFTAASGNGDQMNTEDSMAEDPKSSMPTVPVFGQPAIPSSSPGFVFGATARSPFQFGGQQNQNPLQNPPSFQPSGSQDFSASGSFSLGSSDGGDKANRRYVKVKHKNRKR
ncbi:nuclear pore complex protein NUP1-like isoform X2 [Diospyros lotus]|uniref:nuclear pore complex protein NUP1-like isoform X2 n=1 Tax=Diospyros lotus TaxID=55363 RepID=UPI0022538420|nr:nuclear pore complex protein NUP1-like isoform X2 [Diospyros lotus]